ncbi:MAG: hypothetical protein ABF292_11490 [Desulfobacterales bacterium]
MVDPKSRSTILLDRDAHRALKIAANVTGQTLFEAIDFAAWLFVEETERYIEASSKKNTCGFKVAEALRRLSRAEKTAMCEADRAVLKNIGLPE